MTREQRDRYFTLMENFSKSQYRREREYAKYLERYFNPAVDRVDGLTYQDRIEHSKPMSFNAYFS